MSYHRTLSISGSPLPNPLERYRTPFSTLRLQWLSQGRLELEARRAEPRLRFLLGHASMVENMTNTINRHRCDTNVSGRSSHNDGPAHDASRDTGEGHEYSTTASRAVPYSSASFPTDNYHESWGEAIKEARWPLLVANTIGVEEDDEDSEDDDDYEDDSGNEDDEDNDEDEEDGEDVYETCTQKLFVETHGAGHECASTKASV